MNRDKLKDLYEKYNLTKEDIFKHQHYVIITRTGIEKIKAPTIERKSTLLYSINSLYFQIHIAANGEITNISNQMMYSYINY